MASGLNRNLPSKLRRQNVGSMRLESHIMEEITLKAKRSGGKTDSRYFGIWQNIDFFHDVEGVFLLYAEEILRNE